MNTEISIIISTAGYFSEKLFKRERVFGDESKLITYYRSYASSVNDALEEALFQILSDLQKTKLNKLFDFEIYKGTEISLIFREFPKYSQDLLEREIIFEKLVATLQAYCT